MAGKLRQLIMSHRKRAIGKTTGLPHPIPVVERGRAYGKLTSSTLPYREVVPRGRSSSDRREVYKKELQSLAKHGTRTEGKTIYFAHPIQTLGRRRLQKKQVELLMTPTELRDYGYPMLKIGVIPPRVQSDTSSMVREMIKSKKYAKWTKRLAKKAGPLGVAVSALNVLGKDE
jgi:hypothetical protein